MHISFSYFFALKPGCDDGKINMFNKIEKKKNPSLTLSVSRRKTNALNFNQDYAIIYDYEIEIKLHFKPHNII